MRVLQAAIILLTTTVSASAVLAQAKPEIRQAPSTKSTVRKSMEASRSIGSARTSMAGDAAAE